MAQEPDETAQFREENADAINQVMSLYTNYIGQLQAILDDEAPTEAAPQETAPEEVEVKPKTPYALETGSLEPSGHIYGYTPLPTGGPTSSVLYLNDVQKARKRERDAELMRRYQFMRWRRNPLYGGQ